MLQTSGIFQTVRASLAARLGVHEGHIPNRQAGVDLLVAANSRSAWCAPLVITTEAEIFDFTKGYDANRTLASRFGIGRYDEDRVAMYEADFFKSGSEPRTIHMGLDIGAVEGTPVFAPTDAVVWGVDFIDRTGDYGGTVILEVAPLSSELGPLYMLFGHLSRDTVSHLKAGTRVVAGELLGWLGGKTENGGWNSHLHWQLSWLRPLQVDLPGAVSRSSRSLALEIFPDPMPLLRLAIAGGV